MNNKGFTMIELIMVIMIIALLALLSAPNIIKMINRNKRENYNDTIDSIIEAAELYASDNRYNLDFNENCIEVNEETGIIKQNESIYAIITLKDLVDSKNVSSPIKNHCTNTNLDLNTISIKVTLSCRNNSFTQFSLIGLPVNENTDNNGKIKEAKFCETYLE